MRLIMVGAGPFAGPTFSWLAESSHEVLALVTKPAKIAPGRKPPPPGPLLAIAHAHGLPILEPPSINDQAAIGQLRELAADAMVVCDYGQILSPHALAVARLGGLNLHGSLLPKYRGAAPVQWAIYHGESVTGVTVIHMTPKLDAGPALVQRSTAILPDETMPELEARLAEMGVPAVASALEMLSHWDGQSPLGEPQDPAMATRAPRLKKEDGAIDWRRSALQIKDQVRAFQPWPGAFTYWRKPGAEPLRLILEKVQPVDFASSAPPGVVCRRDKKELYIATGHGVLAVQRIQPSGKRVLEIDEFLRGYPIAEGDELTRLPAA